MGEYTVIMEIVSSMYSQESKIVHEVPWRKERKGWRADGF